VVIDWQTPMPLPVDLRDWVAEDDLARLIAEAVEQCGLGRAWTDEQGSGSAHYPPRMTLSLLIYAYARGVFLRDALSNSVTRTFRCVTCAAIPILITILSRSFAERTKHYLKSVPQRVIVGAGVGIGPVGMLRVGSLRAHSRRRSPVDEGMKIASQGFGITAWQGLNRKEF
jgi:hypothetical protein